MADTSNIKNISLESLGKQLDELQAQSREFFQVMFGKGEYTRSMEEEAKSASKSLSQGKGEAKDIETPSATPTDTARKTPLLAK